MQAPYLWRFCLVYQRAHASIVASRIRGSARHSENRTGMKILKNCTLACFGLLLATALINSASALDPGFRKWVQDLWPDAQALGVSRRTFEDATRSLEPDLSLPDLDLPGREGTPPRGQAEFVQTPADYIKESTITRLAEQGRKLAAEHARTLAAIEQKFG